MNRIISILGVLINVIIIYYLYNLTQIGCTCAMNYKRTYILCYTIFIIISGIIVLIFHPKSIFMVYGALPLIILGIINIIYTIQYVDDLKITNCACSESIIRTMMYILAYINALSYSIVLLLLIILIFNMYKNPKILKIFKKLIYKH